MQSLRSVKYPDGHVKTPLEPIIQEGSTGGGPEYQEITLPGRLPLAHETKVPLAVPASALTFCYRLSAPVPTLVLGCLIRSRPRRSNVACSRPDFWLRLPAMVPTSVF